MEDDWDLHAVVRSCCASTSTSSAAGTEKLDYDFSSARFHYLFEPTRDLQSSTELDLHDLCKPFLASQKLVTVSPQSLPVSQLSVLGRLRDPSSEQQIVKNLSQQTQFQQKQQPFTVLNVSKASSTHNPSSRSKKRKNSLKKVCHVAAENLSSDMWSWRKYGQKPIKGSPYPRGYYRCSTSKGCMARKQVERNRSDPGMFIVTYTAEHKHPMPTHRNSLAGSTRLKPMAETTPSSDDPKKPSCSQEMSPVASLSPATEKPESSRDEMADAEDMDDDDGFSGSDMVVDDDFFAGLEDFTAADGEECFSGHFPANLQFPWLASKAATTAAGGG